MKKNGKKFRSLQKKKVCVQEDKKLNTIIQDIKNMLQEDNRMKTISFCNTKIEVHDSILNEYKVLKIEVTEEYLELLWSYHSVYDKNNIESELPKLMYSDLLNRVYLEKKVLGNIIEYNASGNVMEVFDNIDEVIGNIRSDSVYGFEMFHRNGMNFSRRGIDFFGIKYKPLYDQMSWKNGYITQLNLCIRYARRWKKSRASKSYNDPWFKEKIGDISFDEFVQQYVKNFIFSLGRRLDGVYKEMMHLKKRSNNEKAIYNEELQKLLSRYSCNGVTFFERVDTLANYKKASGIYIFSLDDVRGYYIGQTSTDFERRIKAHWTEPSNYFDKTFGPWDVSEIYILKVQNKYLNSVEQDCIASIQNTFLLNKFAGGQEIALVNSLLYNNESYLLPEDELNKILSSF